MRSLLLFILRLIVVAAIAVWLADRPGTARIVWHDYVIETSAAFLGLCVFAGGLVLYLIFRLGHLIKYGPENWRLRRRLKKMRHGQDELTAGLIAVAGGNASEAGRLAVHARKHLGTTAATQLLQAQAAQLAGDHGAAMAIFRILAADPDTTVIGYRGLIIEARREQDWGEVESLVEKLRQVKPKTPWLNVIRFELLVRRQQWDEAGSVLVQISDARLIEPARSKHIRAAVLVATSQAEARLGHGDKSLSAAEQAVKFANDWPPAVINLAQQQMAAGHKRAAHRTIEKHWQTMPHPQLAAVTRSNDGDVLDAYKYIEKLCRPNPDDPASRQILGEAALAADIWGEARRNLIALVNRGGATQSTYRMLARLERRESGDEQAALQWLTKALDAPQDPVWLCCSCGGEHEEWQAVCKHCGQFNRLEWQSPGQSRRGNDVLPLLSQGWLD